MPDVLNSPFRGGAWMKLSLDPSDTTPPEITAESLALADWYDAHPAVRRLWGIRDVRSLRVVVSIGLTHDDDIHPAWVSNRQAWTHELHLLTGRAIQLELVGDCSLDDIEFPAGSVLVANLFWRDATLVPPEIAD
jgi:hypothetical protein